MKMKLEEWAIVPERGHKTDAGLDLKTPYDFTLEPHNSIVIDTGVHVALPRCTVGMLKSKSGLNIKHGITSEGVIDEGYTGSIKAKLYNHSFKTVEFKKGDKITQLVILPVYVPEHIVIVDTLEETERGDNGFGSTGR